MKPNIIDLETGEVEKPKEMIVVSDVRQSIEKAKNVIETTKIISMAKAAEAFYAAQGMEENAQKAREVSLWAQRKAGEFLAEMPKNTGVRMNGTDDLGSTIVEPPSDTPTLADLDIDKHESSRWQMLAEIPEEQFQEYIDEKIANGHELTTGGLLKIAKSLRGRDKETPELPNGKYRVVYADPPWLYTSGEQSKPIPYTSMTIQELCALPIKDMVQDDAVLFMWVTSPLLDECFEVVDAWGFEYKASIVWDKDSHNVGHYVSVRHEFLLICTRGSCKPDIDKLLPSVVKEKRTEHSVKPETFREMIDTMYPKGKRVELFARRPAKGWEVWGNEVS